MVRSIVRLVRPRLLHEVPLHALECLYGHVGTKSTNCLGFAARDADALVNALGANHSFWPIYRIVQINKLIKFDKRCLAAQCSTGSAGRL